MVGLLLSGKTRALAGDGKVQRRDKPDGAICGTRSNIEQADKTAVEEPVRVVDGIDISVPEIGA
jgi:hypothetical protein